MSELHAATGVPTLVGDPAERAARWALLAPYVPRLITDWLTREPQRMARQLDGTLVFVDISGFTKLSERLAQKGRAGAEEVTEVLDAIFARLLDVAYADQGGLVKFGGDALLLLFTGRNHAARGCRAAVGMRAALRAVGRLATSAGEVVLRMSIGVHSGLLQFFLVGGSHKELIVAGPAATEVNARESEANAGEILVSASTAASIDGRAVGRSQGDAYLLSHTPATPLYLEPPSVSAPGPFDLGIAVPSAIRRHLLAGGGQPEHRQAVIAFLRFTGFDALLEDGSLDDAAIHLDRLTRVVQEATDAHEVTFMGTDVYGDGGKFILVAGAPEASGNDEERLLRTVRAILDASGHDLAVCAGVNHGPVFAGTLGMPYRRTYTVMGDAVNVAARLMQAAPAATILSTAGPLERSWTRFSVSGPSPLTVKGKAAPIEAYEVGQLAGSEDRTTRRLPLVGRHAELDLITQARQRALEGTGTTFDIVGESGSGKSRLLEETLAVAAPLFTLGVRCDQYESATAFRAARALLLQVLGLSADAHADVIAHALAASVASTAPELLPWITLLAVPLDLTLPDTPAVAQLHPSFRMTQLERVTTDWLGAAVAEPTVWTIDDAQWMDDASAGLLRHLMADADQRPWLVCIARQETDGGLVPVDGAAVHRISLPPLSESEGRALATTAADFLPGHRIAQVVQRAGGNPLFLLELVAAAAAGGELSADVEAAVTARLDRLAPADRALLRCAAVLGNSFSTEFAEAVLGEQETYRVDNLRALNEFLDEPQPGTFRFRQGVVRDVAYEGLPFRRRRELHARAGAVLEELPDASPELLALHFSRADEHARTWRYARLAGDRAAAKSANVEAAGLYELALASAEKLADIPVLNVAAVAESLGDACELAGLYGQGARAYQHARELVPDDLVRQADLFRKEGFIRERSAKYALARRWYRRGLERCAQAEAAGVPGHAPVRRRLAGLYAAALAWEGKYKGCIRWCRDIVADAEAAGDEAALAHAYYLLDWAYTDLGSPESSRYRALALPIYERLGDRIGQANVLNNLGVDAYYEGRWDEALEYYERSRQARDEAGDVVQSATAGNNIAEVLADQGELAPAEALFTDALHVFRAAGYQAGIALATSNLGRVAALTGRTDEALERLADARDRFEAIGAEGYVLETDARVAEARLLADDPTSALELVQLTLSRAFARPGLAVLVARLQRLRAQALIALGMPEEAQTWLDQSLEVARAANAEHELALTLVVQSALLHRAGRAAEAAEATEESAAILASLGVRVLPSPRSAG